MLKTPLKNVVTICYGASFGNIALRCVFIFAPMNSVTLLSPNDIQKNDRVALVCTGTKPLKQDTFCAYLHWVFTYPNMEFPTFCPHTSAEFFILDVTKLGSLKKLYLFREISILTRSTRLSFAPYTLPALIHTFSLERPNTAMRLT